VRKPTKAALLSALLFPGVGHIYLKSYVVGVVLVGTSFFAILYMITKAVESALQIGEKIQNSGIHLDIETITELVSKQSNGADGQLLNIATTALIICWLIGIIDSYRVGCVRNKKHNKAN